MEHGRSDPEDWSANNAAKGYALSGRIMLSAIVILFAVVVLMVCLHIYARWYLYRTRRRHHARARRRHHLVFYVDPTNPAASVSSPTRGLDASILNSLPVFVYSSKTHTDMSECAVCLSEFEENEKGRRLPKCNHSFHIGCIDMWFHSHSTCPLCRSAVNAETSESASRNPTDVVISMAETEGGSTSALCSTCQHDEDRTGRLRTSSSVGSSSVGSRRKSSELAGVSIEVPRRNENFGLSEDESLLESPATRVQKSPGSRILSLKRILSRDRKSMLSPTSVPGVSCGSVTEFEADIERGTEDTQQIQTQPQPQPQASR